GVNPLSALAPFVLGRIEILIYRYIEHCHHLIKGVKADRKSTRLNSSHVSISYAVFCLKKNICKVPSTTRVTLCDVSDHKSPLLAHELTLPSRRDHESPYRWTGVNTRQYFGCDLRPPRD